MKKRLYDLLYKVCSLKVLIGVVFPTILLFVGKISGEIWIGSIALVIGARAYEKKNFKQG